MRWTFDRRWSSAGTLAVLTLVASVFLSACGGGAKPATPAPGAQSSGSGQPAAGQAAGGQASGGTVKIGVLLPLTGPIASQGNRSKQAAETARDIINDRGGINGKKIEFVMVDAPDANAAVNQANRLITQEKVQIIFGAYSSTLCVPGSEVSERNKVVWWEFSCVDPKFNRRGFKYAFRTEVDAYGMADWVVDFTIKSLAAKIGSSDVKSLKVALLSEDSAYGKGIATQVEKRAEKDGFKLVANDLYNRTTINDFTPVILKLKQAQPDVLIHTAYANDAILFWKQAREQDFNVKGVVSPGAAGYATPDFVKGRGKDADGIFAIIEPINFKTSALNKEAQDVLAEFEKRYNAKYGGYSADEQLSFTGFWMLFDVLKKTGGDTNPDKVREAAMAMDVPEGSYVTGWGLKFDETGNNTRATHFAVQWQDGKQVTVWPDKFAAGPVKLAPLPKWSERK